MRAESSPAPLAQGETGHENTAAAKPLSLVVDCSAGSDLPAPVTRIPLRWAEQLIARGGDQFPEYRSREWLALDDRDPRKVAACVQEAENGWARRQSPADVFAFPGRGKRAREIAEARRPRPGDYMGGPVQWDEMADA